MDVREFTSNATRVKSENLSETQKSEKQGSKYILNIISSTLEDSTTHGLNPIIKREHTVIRILWIVCLIVSTAICSYMIALSITSYFDYETVTKTQKISLISTEFPAVTICNVNPFMTNASADFVEEMILENFIVNPFLTIDQSFSYFSSSALLNMRYLVSTNALDSSRSDLFRKSLGYDISEMMLDCSYNFNSCSDDDWVWFFDLIYGNCYTFNSGKYQNKSSMPIKKSTKVGSQNGLELDLFLYEPVSMRNLAISTGIRLLVHNQTQPPIFYDGVLAQVGTETSFSMKRVFSSRLQQPYSECNSKIDENHSSEIVKLITSTGYRYTQQNCFVACYQYYLVEKCDCFDYSSLLPISTFTSKNIKPCNNLTQLFCDAQRYAEFFSTEISVSCREQCPLECDSLSYNVQGSSSDYPSLVYGKALMNNPKIRAKYEAYNKTDEISYESLKRNLVRISIFYTDLGYEQNEEMVKTDVIDLVSSIGGTLGLFLGMSFLSFVEIFDIFLQICLNKRSQSSNVINVTPLN